MCGPCDVLHQPSRAKGNRVNIPDPAMEIGLSGSSAVTQSNSETSAKVLGRVLFSLLRYISLESACPEIGMQYL